MADHSDAVLMFQARTYMTDGFIWSWDTSEYLYFARQSRVLRDMLSPFYLIVSPKLKCVTMLSLRTIHRSHSLVELHRKVSMLNPFWAHF